MTDVVVIPSKPHSIMGPSSFARVEHCTASAILGRGMKGVSSSSYADEGTVCHYVWEQCLTLDEDPFEYIGSLYQVEGAEEHEEPVLFTSELSEAVETVLEFTRTLKGVKHVERRVSLPGDLIWGWSDLIVEGTPLIVADAKFGRGIDVAADEIQNPIYGLLFLIETEGPDYIREGDPGEVLVNTVYMQPRKGEALKPYRWTRKALMDLYMRLVEVSHDVRHGIVRYHVSDRCRWCPVAAMCPALRLAAKDPAMGLVVPDPGVLDAVDFDASVLDEAVRMLPALDLYAKRVAELAMRYMEAGGQLQNAKLVQKRAMRKWTDEDEAERWLRKRLDSPYQEPKLLSPAMAEKKLVPRLRGEMATLVTKESSGLTMAAADDKREAVVLRPANLNAALIQTTAQRIIKRSTRDKEPKQ